MTSTGGRAGRAHVAMSTRVVRIVWPVALGALIGGCVGVTLRGAGDGRSSYAVPVPVGLDLVAPVPDDNTLTAAKVELGRRLFFDPVLSRDSSMSCASCHQPERYFTNGRAGAVGVHGLTGRRNVPSVLNVAYGRSFRWDGGIVTLEEQVVRPIGSPTELDLDLEELVRRLNASRAYRDAFARAFGADTAWADGVARALASYLRTLRSGNTPVDRYLGGDTAALSTEAKRGFRLFVGKANCSACHIAPLFTDHEFHNTGISWGSGDLGRYTVTGVDRERGAFKVPSLRNVAETAPYMHDGSIATLEDVIAHYDRGGTPNPRLDEEIRPLRLSPEEKRQLVAFLQALTQRSGLLTPSTRE